VLNYQSFLLNQLHLQKKQAEQQLQLQQAQQPYSSHLKRARSSCEEPSVAQLSYSTGKNALNQLEESGSFSASSMTKYFLVLISIYPI
jgi:hypothetical protein